MSAINWLGVIQLSLVIPKAYMAVKQPSRRVWHIVSGTVIGLLGLMMLLNKI